MSNPYLFAQGTVVLEPIRAGYQRRKLLKLTLRIGLETELLKLILRIGLGGWVFLEEVFFFSSSVFFC